MNEVTVPSLYIISTPIGNLSDITFRAIDSLKKVNTLLCEDTRRTAKLLNHYEIRASMMTFADFNENKIIHQLLDRMEQGEVFGLVSDAGTPLVSDPGYKLVREAINRGIKIEVIPGASAVLTALVGSGMTPDKFLFLGFLTKKHTKRVKLLETASKLRNETGTTIIFYEAPQRIIRFLEELKNYFSSDLQIVVARELTKEHEEFIRGNIDEVTEKISHKKGKIKGEFTVLV